MTYENVSEQLPPCMKGDNLSSREIGVLDSSEPYLSAAAGTIVNTYDSPHVFPSSNVSLLEMVILQQTFFPSAPSHI